MFLILLLLLPTFLQAKLNPQHLFHQFVKAIPRVHEEKLLKILHEDFAIYDCHGREISNRDRMIRELQKFPENIHIPVERYFNEQEITDSKIKVNMLGGAQNEYEMVNNTIISEKQKICQNATYSWYSTSLIDYDQLFEDTATSLLDDYKASLDSDYEMDDILDEHFYLNACGFRYINRSEYLRHLRKVQGNVITGEVFQHRITDISADELGELTFKWAGRTVFKANYYSDQKYYKLVSEFHTYCDETPFLTFMIDDEATGYNIAEKLILKYYDALQTETLTSLISGFIPIIECEGQTALKHLNPEAFTRLYPARSESRPRSIFEVHTFEMAKNLSAGEMSFSFLPMDNFYKLKFEHNLNDGTVKLAVINKMKCNNY